jgi:DNA-binding LacI/PurR family transcriptional regulator
VVLAGGGVLDEAYRQPHIQAVSHLEHQGSVVVALAEVAASVPRVTIDNRGAAAEMTRYVVGLGHTRIGAIAGPAQITTARSRLQGMRDVLGDDGLPGDLIESGEFTVEGGERAAEALFARAPRPTAIFALNDQMAVGALTAAHRRGLHVPHDLTIVGFGDTIAARQAWPPLTTVSVPRHEMGAAAMRGLLEQLQGGAAVASRLLDCSLVVRGSCGPPPASIPTG